MEQHCHAPAAVATPIAAPTAARGPTATQDLLKGIWKENPVLVQMLGMCPTMAITNSVPNALAMGLATLFVLLGSGVFVSGLRKLIPNEVRISTYILIIAAFVQIADMGLEAVAPVTHKALGAFIALIVANCLLLARQEAFSARNNVFRSALDAIGMGLGFTLGLCIMGSVREVLGSGSWFGFRVMPASFEPWVIMNLPPGGFLTFGFVLL
ncbi:MAG TPA: electron transport complex subunit RsxE, partial [Gemmatimonadaceae bacterium]|nr:electron transport complex subunit RsxE [Gemmatimonadaceae bacterium]